MVLIRAIAMARTNPGPGSWRRGLGRRSWLTAGLVVALAVVGAGVDEAERTALHNEANRLFREANAAAEADPAAARELFGRAALRFERLASEGGIRNGKLYYNLGNCYFRQDDWGRAILNYRRAEQYRPHDPNLQQNLAEARRRRLDRIEVPERLRVLHTVLFFHYDLAQRTRALILGVAFVGFWLLLTGRLFWRAGRLGWPAAACGLVAVLMAASLAVEWRQSRAVRPGVVIAAEVVARKGDGLSFEPAFTEPLHAGTEFRILEERGDWIAAALDDGRTCWLPAKDIARVR